MSAKIIFLITHILFSPCERRENLHHHKKTTSLKIIDTFCYLCERSSSSSVTVRNAVPIQNRQSCQTLDRFRKDAKRQNNRYRQNYNMKLLVLW